jgi:uncharacterized protein (DUF1800 family)
MEVNMLPYRLRLIFSAAAVLLSACGGSSTDTQPEVAAAPQRIRLASTVITGTAAGTGLTAAQASRFLAQATFGPTPQEISDLTGGTPEAWITNQFAVPQQLHRGYIDAAGTNVDIEKFYESFWGQAVTGKDQLRQRVAFALSEIYVISNQEGGVAAYPRGVASYYDMLGRNAFGNFRQLLQDVALHPMMGIYLSHLHNRKERGNTVPDQNFAREVMQLFSIGLYQLNADGTVKTSNGKPLETYSRADVEALSRVFTGWSWAGPDKAKERFYGAVADANRDWQPMQQYADFHSDTAKNFLGASTNGSGEADLKVALDTLFNHPNVGPFIGRQLIQRLVTSNPSPAYVSRVAAAFANNGSGVRGDMQAVLRAILLDTEARQLSSGTAAAQKVREPALRLGNWMRAFSVHSASGKFRMYTLDGSVGVTPLWSPTVFNFYRPGYTPPNTAIASAGMVAPEMQITDEATVANYLNSMQSIIAYGVGYDRDVFSDYLPEVALAATPDALVERINLLLLNGAMSTVLRSQIVAAVTSVPQVAPNASNYLSVVTAQKYRVYLAIYLAMVSPEYLVQK